MPGFLGRYEFQCDEKGRVSLPSAFRRGAGGKGLVLLQWQPTHLDLYPADTWEGIQANLVQFRRAEPEGAAFFRRILSSATEVEPDKQGRIRLPSRLREAVGLEDAVLLVGAVDRIELWNPGRFDEELESGEKDFGHFIHQIFG
ncbi:MAG: division/cell wall cluster transcriptional repressor MraZ [Longimicrobiales bacterium]